MRHTRWPLFVTGLVLVTGSAGCQMFGGGNSGTASGPSRSFGLEHVPRQSEPPLESTAVDKARGAQPPDVKTASAKQPAVDESAEPRREVALSAVVRPAKQAAVDDSAKRSNALTAFWAGRVPDLVPPQPFPVSARTASASESVADSTE